MCERDHSSHHFTCVCSYQKPDQLGPAELSSVREEDENDEDDEEAAIDTMVIEPPAERWDCETIISESESIQLISAVHFLMPCVDVSVLFIYRGF